MQNKILEIIVDILPSSANIVEIGSGDGSLMEDIIYALGSPFPSITIFEPNVTLYNTVCSKFEDYDGDMTINHMALGSKSGEGILRISTNHVNSSSLCKPIEHLRIWPEIRFDGKQNVRIETLDDMYHGRNIDLLLIDTNGAELDVLAGAAKTIARTHYVLLEYQNCVIYESGATLFDLVEALPDFRLVCTFDDEGNYGNALFEKVDVI